MLGHHGSIVIPESTPYAQEMRKHEATHTKYGAPGRPYKFEQYPLRIYKATRKLVGVGIDLEGFTVHTDDELRNMQSRGYCVTQELALEALEKEQTEHGKLAAEREWEIAHGRLSPRATAEARAAEAEHGARHLPEVPAQPVRRRGPNTPKKVPVPAE